MKTVVSEKGQITIPKAVRQGASEGKLIVCDCVIAEILPALQNREQCVEFVADWQLQLLPLDLDAAMLAGECFGRYLTRGGQVKRVLPDFLIGAHAIRHADRLLARDRGYAKDYFASLELWDPSPN